MNVNSMEPNELERCDGHSQKLADKKIARIFAISTCAFFALSVALQFAMRLYFN